MKPTIDAEFSRQIPPLTQEEYEQLEQSIIQFGGARDPLVVWAGTGILLDGHNRFAICERLGLPYSTVEVTLVDRDAAEDWIDRNQLGRRNLADDQRAMLQGRVYNRLKKRYGEHQGNQYSKMEGGNFCHLPKKTEQIVAEEFGVSPRTVRNAGVFATSVDKLDLGEEVAKGTLKVPRSAVVQAAKIIDTNPEAARQILSGEKKMADVIRETKRAAVVAELESIAVKEVKAAQGVFDVIVIDPPWPMEKIERDSFPNQTAELDYPTMTEDQLSKLVIPYADACHVWLWTTHRFLPMALRLLDTWGLHYACTFVWHKPGGFQPIGQAQYNCEFALYARRGTPKFIDTKAFPTCFEAPRGAHSEKPEEFYAMVRRVTAGRRLDMFNRRSIDGFETWGNQAH